MNEESKMVEDLLEGRIEDDIFFIPIDCSDQCDVKMDNDLFTEGVRDYSYMCGAITALCNAGLKPYEALEYIMNQDTINHNIDVSNITATATIESAKHSFIRNDSETL